MFGPVRSLAVGVLLHLRQITESLTVSAGGGLAGRRIRACQTDSESDSAPCRDSQSAIAKKSLYVTLMTVGLRVLLFGEIARAQASSRHPVGHILRRLIDTDKPDSGTERQLPEISFRRRWLYLYSLQTTPSVIQGSHGTTYGRWCE